MLRSAPRRGLQCNGSVALRRIPSGSHHAAQAARNHAPRIAPLVALRAPDDATHGCLQRPRCKLPP
eukprot:1130039-Rhodomonas_salina.4